MESKVSPCKYAFLFNYHEYCLWCLKCSVWELTDFSLLFSPVQVWQCSGQNQVSALSDCSSFTCRRASTHRTLVDLLSCDTVGLALLSPHLPRPTHPACDTDSRLCPPTKVSECALHLREAGSEYSCKPWNAFVCFYWTNNIRHKQGFVSRTPLWSF